MSTRTLIWHSSETVRAGERMGPAFYTDAEFDALAVRIDAATAPNLEDALFDILVDGVSIFANQTPTPESATGRIAATTSTTGALLPKGQNREEIAEDFKEGLNIAAGSWVTCVPRRDGGGKNFTVILELEEVGEHEE